MVGWTDFAYRILKKLRTSIRFQVEVILTVKSSGEEVFEVNGKPHSYQVQ